MKKILVDCDLTFGVPQHPMDDGLAILYLLGEPDVEIVGITCTFGNADIGTTFEATKKMMEEIGRPDIPVFAGAMPSGLEYRRNGQRYEVTEVSGPGEGGHRSRISDAARFMADEARRLDGELQILALGAQTNLAGAWEEDQDFFDHLTGVTCMGCITEPLILNGTVLGELNFSVDPEAGYTVLTKGRNVTLLTGNHCLPSYTKHETYEERLLGSGRPIGRYIYESTSDWFREKVLRFGLDGFYNWDEAAAARICGKPFFSDQMFCFTPSVEDLGMGFIGGAPSEASSGVHSGASSENAVCINTPVIADPEGLEDSYFRNWLGLEI